MINTNSSFSCLHRNWNQMTRGYFGVFLLVCALPCFLCGCPAQKNATQTVVSALTGEQLAVYKGFLDALSSAGFKNLATTTVAFDLSEIKPSSPCLKGLQFESSSDSGRSVHSLGPEIVAGRKLELADAHQQTALIASAGKTAVQQAGESKEQATTAALEHGFLVLSEIAFDKTHQFAVLKYNFVCGAHCLTSQTYVLARVGAEWKVKGRPCTMLAN